MERYIYFWIFFVVVRALHQGYNQYKEYRVAGYNVTHFEQTGEKIEFHGGTGEAISCTLVGALGLLVFPMFLIMTTIYYLPAALVLYFISR